MWRTETQSSLGHCYSLCNDHKHTLALISFLGFAFILLHPNFTDWYLVWEKSEGWERPDGSWLSVVSWDLCGYCRGTRRGLTWRGSPNRAVCSECSRLLYSLLSPPEVSENSVSSIEKIFR